MTCHGHKYLTRDQTWAGGSALIRKLGVFDLNWWTSFIVDMMTTDSWWLPDNCSLLLSSRSQVSKDTQTVSTQQPEPEPEDQRHSYGVTSCVSLHFTHLTLAHSHNILINIAWRNLLSSESHPLMIKLRMNLLVDNNRNKKFRRDKKNCLKVDHQLKVVSASVVIPTCEKPE